LLQNGVFQSLYKGRIGELQGPHAARGPRVGHGCSCLLFNIFYPQKFMLHAFKANKKNVQHKKEQKDHLLTFMVDHESENKLKSQNDSKVQITARMKQVFLDTM
jgi:hypothetical protein